MPGIELLDYTMVRSIDTEDRDAIIEVVHDVLTIYNKRPTHSNFRYSPAGPLDTSGYNYILVVDGETTPKTIQHQERIRKEIKRRVAQAFRIEPEEIAVRYRLMNSSFG